MNRTDILDWMHPDCPVRNILARVCDKWSMIVLHTLYGNGGAAMRFGELSKKIDDISQKMLTVTLRTLEEDGYVSRKIYPEVPPKVEYSLTVRGNDLWCQIQQIATWAKDNMDAIISDRKKYRRKRK